MTADERGARRIQLVDGRDSSDMDGFLDFDEPTRRLIYRDARQVLDEAHREEMDNAAEAVLAVIEQTPGLSQNSLEAALKNRGDGIGTPRLKGAVEYLIRAGRVHVQAKGKGFAHYPGPSKEFLALQAK
ncbi:hypothetical protein [Luteococcus sp. OSA5]|uniref:hypothetical protein n=1 Tax=Luteococcus sp. OSA5 TaxID=3401630 RepID=UPI003B432C63